MPNTKNPPPGELLFEQIKRLLNATKADKDEVTHILIAFLAIQIASYDPIDRLDVWDAAVDELDDMVEVCSEQVDKEFLNN
jgi:uncharacterized protein with HEPN domain